MSSSTLFSVLLAPLYFLLFIQGFSALAQTTRNYNVTVDDTNSTVVYGGKWEDHPSPLNYGGGHRTAQDDSAMATFVFTGVAIYVLNPKWPYNVNTAVSLDNGPKQTIDLVDRSRAMVDGGPETQNYSVVWFQENLENKTHTLALSKASGGDYVVVDGFIYTQQFPAEEEKKKSPAVPIAVGVSCGLAVLLLAGLGIFLCRRRKMQKSKKLLEKENWPAASVAPFDTFTSPGPAGVSSQMNVNDMTQSTVDGGSTAPLMRPRAQLGKRSMSEFGSYSNSDGTMSEAGFSVYDPYSAYGFGNGGHPYPPPLGSGMYGYPGSNHPSMAFDPRYSSAYPLTASGATTPRTTMGSPPPHPPLPNMMGPGGVIPHMHGQSPIAIYNPTIRESISDSSSSSHGGNGGGQGNMRSRFEKQALLSKPTVEEPMPPPAYSPGNGKAPISAVGSDVKGVGLVSVANDGAGATNEANANRNSDSGMSS